MNLFTKQKQTHRLQSQTYGYQRGKVGGRRYRLEVQDQHIHSTVYKTDNQQGPTVGSENSIQHSTMAYIGKESQKEWIYDYL